MNLKSDMMKKILLTIAALATLFSCSSIDEVADKYAAGDYVESVEMTVEDFEEDATTRTALSNLTDTGAKFAWAEKDTVGIFPNVGDQVSFSMSAGAGTSSATFNGGGWALCTSSSYSAYYPFSRANFYRNSKTIAINMVGQTQNGNDDTSEIGAFDIMAAAPASAETGNVKFAFKHQVSICRIKLTLPASKSYKSVKVIAPSKKFITEAKLDISVATPTIIATKTSEEISLSLKNFSTTSTNKELVANMYVLPVDMSGEKLTVEVTDVDNNVYTAENVTGVNFEKAKIRILNAAPTAPGGDGEGEGEDFTGDEEEIEQPLTFTALEDNSTIALIKNRYSSPNVEFSMDGINWTTWDYSAITLAKNQKVYMRGNNPYGFSSSDENYSKFKMTGKIAASGNIMSLLFSAGFENELAMAFSHCFYCLFSGCASLTNAPVLPATTLGNYCYYSMFSGCTSLTEAPVLPATTLANYCYGSMFNGCTKLNSVKAAFTSTPGTDTFWWLSGVSSTGTFYKNKNATWDVTGSSGIPSGWNVVLYDTDESKCEIEGHEYVDLGLSVKWATCNVGADKPEDYGGYYAWGETSTKYNYSWSNCFDCLDNDDVLDWSIYKIGGKTKIEPNSGHDTARENWGGTWRMPTEVELGELKSKCTWTWTLKGGHNGYVVTGPNGNSIFLPAAGYCYDTSSVYVGEFGFYSSSTLSYRYSDCAEYLRFDSSGHVMESNTRYHGYSVRPVTE